MASENKVEISANGDIVVGDGVSNVWVRMGGLTIQLSQGGDCGTDERPTVMIDAWAADDAEGAEPLGVMEVGKDFATFTPRPEETR